jgi:hypothetical protein
MTGVGNIESNLLDTEVGIYTPNLYAPVIDLRMERKRYQFIESFDQP